MIPTSDQPVTWKAIKRASARLQLQENVRSEAMRRRSFLDKPSAVASMKMEGNGRHRSSLTGFLSGQNSIFEAFARKSILDDDHEGSSSECCLQESFLLEADCSNSLADSTITNHTSWWADASSSLSDSTPDFTRRRDQQHSSKKNNFSRADQTNLLVQIPSSPSPRVEAINSATSSPTTSGDPAAKSVVLSIPGVSTTMSDNACTEYTTTIDGKSCLTATVTKETPKKNVGVTVQKKQSDGRFFISSIRVGGLFSMTGLEVGMIVLRVNDVNVDAQRDQFTPKDVMAIMKEAEEDVTIVAEALPEEK